MDVDVEEIFETLNEREGLEFEEFRALVERKMESLGGLCDYETAAKLVASDMGVNPEVEFKDIGDISEDDEYVSLVGKIVHIGGTHEFSREDGSAGRVANMHLADSTGEVRVAVWDQLADMVKVREIEEGEVLRIEGARVRSGPKGVELSVGSSTEVKRDESDVEVDESVLPIGKLEPGLGSVHVKGRVLDVEEERTFDRDDGSTGRVASLSLGDESGRIRLSAWDERVEELAELEPGDSVVVKYGYTRERYGRTELHVGKRGSIEDCPMEVRYEDRFTPLDDVLGEGEYDVRGKATAVDDVHRFERDDGSEGMVANVYLEDDSGSVRCAFWDENAEEVQKVSPGDELVLRGASGRTGRDGTPELSVGWRGSFEVERGDETYQGSIEGLSGGKRVELRGQIVTWDGVLDDGRGCVETEGEPLPFGRTMEVTGVSEKRDGKLTVRVGEAEIPGISAGEVESLLKRLERA